MPYEQVSTKERKKEGGGGEKKKKTHSRWLLLLPLRFDVLFVKSLKAAKTRCDIINKA